MCFLRKVVVPNDDISTAIVLATIRSRPISHDFSVPYSCRTASSTPNYEKLMETSAKNRQLGRPLSPSLQLLAQKYVSDLLIVFAVLFKAARFPHTLVQTGFGYCPSGTEPLVLRSPEVGSQQCVDCC